MPSTRAMFAIITLMLFVVGMYFIVPRTKTYDYQGLDVIVENEKITNPTAALEVISGTARAEEKEPEPLHFVATHVDVPKEVKAIYMSSWVAGTPHIRDRLVRLLDDTEANAVVIDIKDYTGKISFPVDEEPFKSLGSDSRRISDIREFIALLHEKEIYVIGRISVFQDPHLVAVWPDEAVKLASDPTNPWKDHKGISWVDAGSEKVWDYTAKLARHSYHIGFDEINFDYIRFPSDGNMKDILYPHSQGKIKSEVMKSFFEFLDNELRQGEPRMTISADFFGMTATNTDDLGIGQVLEHGLLHFDYVAPMVYPSHFPPGWAGMAQPAENPYDVIHRSMTSAVKRAEALGVDIQKLRPWLQDFNLGAVYTKEMVNDQMQATYDTGLTSWMLWDPKNIYTRSALITQ